VQAKAQLERQRSSGPKYSEEVIGIPRGNSVGDWGELSFSLAFATLGSELSNSSALSQIFLTYFGA